MSGCVVAFGLMFAGAGLLALVPSVRQYGTKPNRMVGIVAGGVFMLAGLGIVVGSMYGASNLKRKAALQTTSRGCASAGWASGGVAN